MHKAHMRNLAVSRLTSTPPPAAPQLRTGVLSSSDAAFLLRASRDAAFHDRAVKEAAFLDRAAREAADRWEPERSWAEVRVNVDRTAHSKRAAASSS